MKSNDSNKNRAVVLPPAKCAGLPKSEMKPKSREQSADQGLPQPSALKSLGTAICDVHAATKKSGFELLLGAGKCGLLLLVAKETVKHGDFEPWFEAEGFGFSKVTRCKYMRLAERLCELGKSKPGLLATVVDTSHGRSYVFNEETLQKILTQACAGQTLSDLYVQWDIAKSGSKRGEAAKEPIAGKNSPDRIFGRMVGMVEKLPGIFLQLQPEKRSQLIAQLELLLKQLQTTPPTIN